MRGCGDASQFPIPRATQEWAVISESATVKQSRSASFGVVPSHLYALSSGMKISGGGRIHPASRWLMTTSRSHLAGPTHDGSRISIILLAAQPVKGGFGQMSRHGAHRLVMSFAPAQPRIRFTDVSRRTSLIVQRHRVRRFGKRPLQIPIHILSAAKDLCSVSSRRATTRTVHA
jgi:hypothetical protein